MLSLIMQLCFFSSVSTMPYMPTRFQDKTVKQLFDKNCSRCHGKDGLKKISKNKNLINSDLNLEQTSYVISFGKKRMPAWGKKFNKAQIDALTEYVIAFRK
jgi:cytochrome c6